MSVLFGGAFDPVHRAHLALAEFVSEELQMPIHFLPAGQSPLKTGAGAGFGQRVRMLELALRDTPFLLDSREGSRTGPSWTVDTLEELKKESGTDLFWLLGTDQLEQFRRWHRWERILELAQLVVINRPGSVIVKDPVPHLPLEWPGMELSSTWLRERITQGKRCRELLPAGVWEYICEQELYH